LTFGRSLNVQTLASLFGVHDVDAGETQALAGAPRPGCSRGGERRSPAERRQDGSDACGPETEHRRIAHERRAVDLAGGELIDQRVLEGASRNTELVEVLPGLGIQGAS
jgi:hypothetical protein